jgi:DNA replication protein DnaD
MKNKGWTKLYRGQFVHWISKKPFCDGYAWSYLYSQANHKPGVVNLRNEYIKVERGQFITSKKKLMEFFGWTRSHLNNFIKSLKMEEMITYRMTHRYIVITIINYTLFQGSDKNTDPQPDPQTDIQTTYRRPTVVHKQECIKNDLRMNKELSDAEIEKNKENVTKSKNLFLDIVKKKKKGDI